MAQTIDTSSRRTRTSGSRPARAPASPSCLQEAFKSEARAALAQGVYRFSEMHQKRAPTSWAQGAGELFRHFTVDQRPRALDELSRDPRPAAKFLVEYISQFDLCSPPATEKNLPAVFLRQAERALRQGIVQYNEMYGDYVPSTAFLAALTSYRHLEPKQRTAITTELCQDRGQPAKDLAAMLDRLVDAERR